MRPLLLLAFAALAACGTDKRSDERAEAPVARQGPLDIRSLSFPAHWLVERVGGEHVQVRNVMPIGEDAPHWRPEAELIAGLAQADLIVGNGAGYEAWTATATLPTDKLVFTAQGVELIRTHSTTHSHGSGGSHSHGEVDPHTWASPRLYAQQAEALSVALGRLDPAHAGDFTLAAASLSSELSALGERYIEVFARRGDASLACGHPSYRYLARQLGIEIEAFELDPKTPPSEEAIATVQAWAEGRDQLVLFWEAVPTSEVKAALPGDIQHVLLDPLEQPRGSEAYDYLEQSRANLATLEDLFPPVPLEANKTPGKPPPSPGTPAQAKPDGKKLKHKGVKKGR
jgi:zinc transport system substrate-binding protein